MIAVIAMAFMLSSCAGTGTDGGPSEEPTASPLPEVYHNGAYGISVTVPEGWIVAGVNDTNMTDSPGKSADIGALEIIPYEDFGSEIQLIELWSRIDSADKEHASLMVYIEIYDGMDEQTYLQCSRMPMRDISTAITPNWYRGRRPLLAGKNTRGFST